LTIESIGATLCSKFIDILGDCAIIVNYTTKYTKINSGYIRQIVEWSEVVTDGDDLETFRAML